MQPTKLQMEEESVIPIDTVDSLDLFARESMQMSIVNSYDYSVSPQSTYSASTPLVFDIPGSSTLFLDPAVYLSVTVWIKQQDGTELPADSKCAPECNFANTMFSGLYLV